MDGQPSRAKLPNARQLMSQFNVAFGLMSVVPLLICLYLITVKFFSISILEGLNGVYFLLAVLIALLGLLVGRVVIQTVIRQLVETNAKLARLYNQQASFVSNVSHEFRSPLTIVKGSLDNLADGLHGPLTTDQSEPVGMCQREINRLKRLVSDLLDLARMEAGKLPMVKQEVVLQEVIKAVAQLLAAPFRERKLNLAVDLPEAPIRVIGDRDRLQQVFMNLLTNALKFTETGRVHVQLSREDEYVRVDVVDTGRGIAKDDLGKIFDKFERVGGETEEGSGLGLPIAKDIVELHYGTIWAESQAGTGSRFVVRLPAKPSADG